MSAERESLPSAPPEGLITQEYLDVAHRLAHLLSDGLHLQDAMSAAEIHLAKYQAALSVAKVRLTAAQRAAGLYDVTRPLADSLLSRLSS